ncbi:MAG: bifunctional ornithine acetyltransferase/N-acetylglutamate synthase, partial [Gammaproteobacteria bacterium]
DYQNARLSRRFMKLVDSAPAELRESVAKGYYKLLAYKDEYEVARLHLQTAERVAEVLGVASHDVAVCSTGLIGELLPMDKVLAGVDAAAGALAPDGGEAAAVAIRTTDTVHKQAVAERDGWVVGGMAKGAGMIAPDMATMLSFIFTDAPVSSAVLQSLLKTGVEDTFNAITI